MIQIHFQNDIATKRGLSAPMYKVSMSSDLWLRKYIQNKTETPKLLSKLGAHVKTLLDSGGSMGSAIVSAAAIGIFMKIICYLSMEVQLTLTKARAQAHWLC